MEGQEEIVYHGQKNCQFFGKRICNNKAYYKSDNMFLCGVHAKSKNRVDLPRMTAKQKKKQIEKDLNAEKERIENAAKINRENCKKGNVILYKMRMMKSVENFEGYLKVFPNFKHQNRKDGFGCSRLSPMSLGPVNHGQPNMPSAKNLENFHQGSKCFTNETDKEGNPSEVFVRSRLKFYNDPIPHRHKYKKNKDNYTLYFVWVDKNGKEHHLSVIECRQFYCNFYNRLALQQEDFMKLKKMINDGYNIQLCGYDARALKKEQIEKAYLDPSSPFGHELVLFSMLTLEEKDFPWLKYKTFDF